MQDCTACRVGTMHVSLQRVKSTTAILLHEREWSSGAAHLGLLWLQERCRTTPWAAACWWSRGHSASRCRPLQGRGSTGMWPAWPPPRRPAGTRRQRPCWPTLLGRQSQGSWSSGSNTTAHHHRGCSTSTAGKCKSVCQPRQQSDTEWGFRWKDGTAEGV